MPLKESGEMYLETIYILQKSQPRIRSIDIAEQMNYSRASVSRAMGLLREQDYIRMEQDGSITLTKAGNAIAGKIHERHRILSRIFMALGVDEETATEDACRIEHVISDRCFEAIKRHFENFREE